jgi:hypothetical protein
MQRPVAAHLAVLQVKSRVGKPVEIAGVVIMQMGDDDVPDGVGADAEACQRVHRVERELATAQLRLFGVETSIDQNIAAMAPDQPDEIVEVGSRRLVRIGHEEIQMRRARRQGRIAQGEDFVGVSHRFRFWSEARSVFCRSKPPPCQKVKPDAPARARQRSPKALEPSPCR